MAMDPIKKLYIMSAFTLIYLFLELIVGYMIDSLALISDAYHMLSDLASLGVALLALKFAKKKPNKKMTFGWVRAEPLGGLVNAVFLASLCFTIVLEAFQRLAKPPEIDQPILLISVACAGLCFNIAGMLLFKGHGSDVVHQIAEEQEHAHEHQHQHDENCDHDKTKLLSNDDARLSPASSAMNGDGDIELGPVSTSTSTELTISTPKTPPQHKCNHDHSKGGHHHNHGEEEEGKEKKGFFSKLAHGHHHHHHHGHGHGHGGSMTMHSVFIHLVGDALGSIAVISSGLLIWLTDYSWRFYADPIISLFISLVIIKSAVPLALRTSAILLNSVPETIDVPQLRKDLLEVRDVLGIHEFHVWNLVDGVSMCSMHVVCRNSVAFMGLAADLKKVLHSYGIHSTCIQPEYIAEDVSAFETCATECKEKSCKSMNCCKEIQTEENWR